MRESRARAHHILPDTGWVSYPIHGEEGVQGALDLFRLAYDRTVAQRGLPEIVE